MPPINHAKPRLTFQPGFKANERGEYAADEPRCPPRESPLTVAYTTPGTQDHLKNLTATDIEAKRHRTNTPMSITPQMIDAEIADEAYHASLNGITVCILTLRNGFTVTGESRLFDRAAVHPDIVRDLAKGKARQKMRELLAFRLADQRQLERQRAELMEFQRAVADDVVDEMIAAALGKGRAR